LPLLDDLLLRFRRIWAPVGPVAGQTGVPEEAGAGLDTEITDLSRELAAIDDEATAILRAAEEQAAGIRAAAHAEASRIGEQARTDLPGVRASQAARRVEERQAEIGQVLAAAEQSAGEIRERARSRMPELVDRVAAEVFGSVAAAKEDHARVLGGR
jgi:F0F1-type ATP synthase membrane subunit b/b'